MRLLLSSYSFFIKAPSAAVCKALISLVFYYHPYQSLAKMGFPRVCISFLKPYPGKFFLFFSNIDIIFSLYIIESMMT